MFEWRTVLIIGIFCYISDIDVSYNFNSHTAHYVHSHTFSCVLVDVGCILHKITVKLFWNTYQCVYIYYEEFDFFLGVPVYVLTSILCKGKKMLPCIIMDLNFISLTSKSVPYKDSTWVNFWQNILSFHSIDITILHLWSKWHLQCHNKQKVICFINIFGFWTLDGF